MVPYMQLLLYQRNSNSLCVALLSDTNIIVWLIPVNGIYTDNM